LVALGWFGASSASAATLTVCPSGCPYTQIAPAVAAASSGDTVDVAGGTYHGGFTIDKNLTLSGAGAEETTIRGGGPVITVGTDGPRVSRRSRFVA
jgi:nitrous oxidase accessory protein NosD